MEKPLNKPFRTPKGPKKFAVYVKNKSGNTVIVRFGDPNMEIKRDDPERRKSFRARHKCDSQKDKTKAAYWSCRMWSKKPVSKIAGNLDVVIEVENDHYFIEASEEWDGETFIEEGEAMKYFKGKKVNYACEECGEEMEEDEEICGKCKKKVDK